MKKAAFPVMTLLPLAIIFCMNARYYIGFIFLPIGLILAGLIWYFAIFRIRKKFSHTAKIITGICLWAAAAFSAVSPYIIFMLA